MSKQEDNPIILGRRNCQRCLRWKLAIEFRWRWRNRHLGYQSGITKKSSKPTIDTICIVCRREMERERYNGQSTEKKQEWVQRANANARKRREQAARERQEARLIIAENRRLQRELHGLGSGNLLPFTPFRMWLIGRLRRYNHNESELARQTGIPQTTLQNYLRGYAWPKPDGEISTHSWCEPQPIYTVHVNIVDRALLAEGSTNLEELYPWRDE